MDFTRNINIKNLALFIVGIILVLFSAFRGLSIDSYYYYDTYNYIKIFNSLDTISTFTKEVGYYLINLFIKIITDNYRILFLTISLATIVLTCKYIKYYTNRWILGIASYTTLFYYIREFSQMRASLAYAIVIFSSIYLIKHENKKFIIGILIATTIHLSASIGIIIYFFRYREIKSSKLYSMLIICLILFNISWLSWIMKILQPFIGNFYIDKIIEYITYGEYRGFDVKVIMYFTIAFLTIYSRKYVINDRDKFNIKLNMLIIGMIILSLFSGSDILSVRMSELYITSIALIIPDYVDIIKNIYIKFIVYIGIVLCLSAYTIRLFIYFGERLIY